MITIRKANQRGFGDHGWLQSRHTFSFARYYDPEYMGFSVLRVINEDRIQGGMGFDAHQHQDMEIISYVITGALEHKDSMGNTTIIRPGEVQVMSAGTGVEHSEYNHVKDQETHFFQIWILPNKKGLVPSYGQKSFEAQLQEKRLVLVASKDGRDGSMVIHQDADLYLSKLKAGEKVQFELHPKRKAWIHIIHGDLAVNGSPVQTGDGLAANEETLLEITANGSSELLLFDLP